MATSTLYYGGTGTDPFVRIQVTEDGGVFQIKVTQVKANDADASLDPDGKFYYGDVRDSSLILPALKPSKSTISKLYSDYNASLAKNGVHTKSVIGPNDLSTPLVVPTTRCLEVAIRPTTSVSKSVRSGPKRTTSARFHSRSPVVISPWRIFSPHRTDSGHVSWFGREQGRRRYGQERASRALVQDHRS